jgi:two-component system response regulator RegA
LFARSATSPGGRLRSPPETTAERPDVESAPTLARVEWEHIDRVLADCGGNVSKAARALGIHRRSLQRKLSKFPSSR